MVWSAKSAALEAWATNDEYPFFDGINDNLNLGDVFDQLGNYSIEAEVYPFTLISPVDSLGMRVLAKDDFAAVKGWALSVGDGATPGQFRHFNREATSSGVVDSGVVIVVNTWQHIAVSYDSGPAQATLYYNGVQVAQGSVDADATDNAAALMIGAGGASGAPTVPSKFFNGRMRNVRLWSDARTAPEILANKDRSVPAGSAGLVLQKFAWADKATTLSSWSDV